MAELAKCLYISTSSPSIYAPAWMLAYLYISSPSTVSSKASNSAWTRLEDNQHFSKS